MVQKKFNNKVLQFSLVVGLSIAVAIIPGFISEDFVIWCKQFFGPSYILYLFGVMMIGSLVVMFLTSNYTKEVFSDSKKIQLKKFGIPPTKANQSLLKDAKTAISQSANTKQALLLLGRIRSNSLDVEIALLNARLVEESRIRHQEIASYDEVSRTFNRITKDTLYLIRELEKEINSEEVQDETIRTYLQNRYFFRLSQKLSGRQPVNLKYIPSTEGTSEETSVYYVFKGNKEIQQGISQIFREANGRLLIIGDPGAGKTTLLLQLALDLLKNEPNGIPVMLNLATWVKEFISIETWLAEILPAELGITKRAGQELVEQNRLVLILDGFDEIKEEDRNECLEAIGQYSVMGERRFVISSRKKEFIHVTKDAPVYAQIEIRPLAVEQIIEALDKIGYDQPEAKPLILALQKDTLLGEVAQTPFYFNLLQLLFAGGKRLSDFNFQSTDVENRRKEILECFILYGLSPKQPGDYSEKQLQRWLAFFASRLKLKNLVTFELTNLQYDWWIWPRWKLISPKLVSYFASSTFAGFLMLAVVIFSLFFKSLILIGFYIYIITMLSILTTITEKKLPRISTTEKFKFSIKKISSHFLKRFFFLGILASLLPFLATVGTLTYNKIITSWFFKDASLSLLDKLFWGFTVGGLFFILVFIMTIFLTFHSVTINIVNPYDRFILSSKWLHFSIFQHKLLCFQLWMRDLLPYNLVFFLKEMSNRHILEFNGCIWRFQHRLIQDYFVSTWDLQYQGSSKLKLSDAEAYQKLAQSFYNQNKLEEAIENFQKTVQLNPNKSEAYNSLGNAYYSQYEYDKAIDCYKKAANIAPKYVIYYCNVGLTYYQMNKYEEAIIWYKKAIQIRPKHSEAYNYLGNAYYSQKIFTEAAHYYQEAIRREPQNSIYYSNLSWAQIEKKDYNIAIDNIKKAIQLSPGDASYYNTLGNIMFNLNNYDEAAYNYRKATQLQSENAFYHNNMGHSNYKQKKYEEAVANFQQAIHLNIEYNEAYNHLGNTFYALGNFDEAIKCYQKASEIEPSFETYRTNIGLALCEQNKYEEAIQLYKEVIAENPNSSVTYSYMGNAYYERKNYDDAIACYQKAIDLDFKNIKYYIQLSNVFYDSNRHVEAIACCEKILSLEPLNSVAYLNMGYSYQAQKKLDEAIECFQKSIELDPASAMPYYFLGSVFYSQNNLDYAIENYRKATQLSPNDAMSNFNLGITLMDQNKIEEGFVFLTKSVQLNPIYLEAWANLGWWHLKQRNFEEAKKAFQKMEELQDSIIDRPKRYLGHIALMTNDLGQAMGNYKESVRLAEDKALFFERMKTNFSDLKMVDFISNIAYDEILDQLHASITHLE